MALGPSAIHGGVRQAGPITVEIRLGVALDQRAFEALAAELLRSGAAEVSDRADSAGLTAAFPPEITPKEAVARASIATAATGLPLLAAELSEGPAVDWSGHWRRHFRPMQFGPLWVVPAWSDPPEDAAVVLELDPGLAFGTGAHATSALCLEWLVARLGEGAVPRLLDLGTGSGLLALAALLLGVEQVVGADIDPDAISTAAHNARANGLQDRLELRGAEWSRPGERFPVVIANLVTIPLLEDSGLIAASVEPGGVLVMSGVQEDEVEEVRGAYEAIGFGGFEVTVRDGWARLVGRFNVAPGAGA